MIKFSNMRQYTHIVDGIMFPQNKNEPVLLVYMSENSIISDDFERLNLRNIDFRKAIIPVTKIPVTRLTTNIRSIFKARGITALQSNQTIPEGQNLIYDLSFYLNKLDQVYKVNTYRQRAGFLLNNMILKTFSSFPSNYQKILLYSVDPKKNINEFINRKIFPILLNIKKDEIIPFDHMLFNTLSDDSSRYRLLIKDKEYKFDRIKTLLKKVKIVDTEEESIEKVKNATKFIMKKVETEIEPKHKLKVASAIYDYFEQNQQDLDKTELGMIDNSKAQEIATTSILAKSTGNLDAAKRSVESIPKNRKSVALKAISKQYADELLQPQKTESTSDNIVIQESNVTKAVDNKSPEHLFEKRKIDFETNLKKDITNSFKVLSSKDVPLRIKTIKIIPKPEKPGELKPSDISTIQVTLLDDYKNTHIINLDIPNIREDGTFHVNGKKKCLINQMVLLPISFPKPYDGKFESSYSTFHIWSKRTKRESYLEAYIGSYKLPFLILLGYSFGFEETLKLYDVKYEITEEKPEKGTPFFTMIDDKRYIIFKGVESDLQKELCQSLLHGNISQYKINKEFGTKDYFNDLIIKIAGRINSTFLIQSNLDNIIDPVVKQVLINKQLPSDLQSIMKYMATKVVTGFQHDRNDVSNQRIRNSEVLVHLAQKQILAAHTEYKEQVLSGNKKAIFDISQSKVLSDFINSEIVADMEYANPVEEMATKTRVSPVGKNIGGIPDKQAIQNEGRAVHDSMFGNIDTLDTPEGDNVGIVQQLTLDAYITSARGIIHEKEIKEGENSGLLSTSTALIPFVEKNDGARVMFGANQARQTVPLKNPEPPIIQSGYESILTSVLSDAFIKRSPCTGKVMSIAEDEITVKCTNGKNQKIDTSPTHLRSGSGKDTLSVFKNKVKVGQVIKEKSVVAEGSCMSEGTISLGRTLCVALMPYKGYNFEDGIVISESVFKNEKLTSLHGVVEEILISKNDRLMFINKIGTITKKGEPLLRKTIGEIEQLIGYDEEEEGSDIAGGQFIKKSPGGKIVDIEIFSNTRITKYPELRPLIERTKKKYKMAPTEKFTVRGEQIQGVLVRFKLEQELLIGVGDKLTNRHGAKGVIALIEKEENMPISPTGDRVEIILNPIGVIGRMNMGQYYELYTGLIAKELGRRIIELNNKIKIISLLNQVLPKLDMSKNKEFSKSLINKFKTMSDSRFKIFMNQISKSKSMTILIPPFKSPAYKEITSAMKILGLKSGYKLKLPEYGTNTKYDVPIGYQYILKLEHIAAEKIHSRSTGPLTQKIQQPTGGKKLEGGQRMGEADTYSFISYNCPNLLAEFFGPMSDDHGTKNEILADIIQHGNARYRSPKTSPVRDLLSSYFLSLMLWR